MMNAGSSLVAAAVREPTDTELENFECLADILLGLASKETPQWNSHKRAAF